MYCARSLALEPSQSGRLGNHPERGGRGGDVIYTARGVELTLKHCPLLPCIPHRKALPCHPDIVPSYREANQYPVEGVVCMRPSNRLRSAQKGPWASSSATPTLPRLRAPLARPAHLAAGQSWGPGAPFQAGEVLLPTAGPSFLCRLLHPIRVTIPGCVSVASRWPAKARLWPLLTGETCEQAAQPSAEPSLALSAQSVPRMVHGAANQHRREEGPSRSPGL